jgi:hypothetical protein
MQEPSFGVQISPSISPLSLTVEAAKVVSSLLMLNDHDPKGSSAAATPTIIKHVAMSNAVPFATTVTPFIRVC